jgi:glutathione S-transferase
MMHAPYILHYAPDNASLVIRLALEEMGVPYTTSLVDRRKEAQKSEDYRALNPSGLIPVLETANGPIFETAAILLWLVDKHRSLGPAPEAPERADFLKWLFFFSNTLHPALRRLFYAHDYIGDDPRDQAILRKVTRQRIRDHLQLVETRWQAEPKPALALTIYLVPMLRWLALYPASLDSSWFALADYPALQAFAADLETRASSRTASHLEGLGSQPFTNPKPPDPPEGSAI